MAIGAGGLCMAIVGGALVPVLGGVIADRTSLAAALILPAACYWVIAGFGWFSRRAAVPMAGAPVAV